MPDPIPAPTNPTDPTPANPGEGNKGGEGGNDPTKTVTTPPVALDLSKIGDDDFAKIFEDPRLYKHPRFKSLNERAKKADEYDEAEKKRQQDELTKKGDFEKVLLGKDDEIKTLKEQITTSQINSSIQTQAAKLGVVDLEAVLKLIDRANIKVDENGTVTGTEDAVKALLEAKPYLKGKSGQVTVGTPTNPGQNTEGIKTFKLSQIQDPVFYRANEKDIDAALKAGLVENDLAQGQPQGQQ